MNKTAFQIYGIRKTRYYGFLPSEDSFIISQSNKSTYGYFYGDFTGYTETGINTSKKNLIKLNQNLTIDNSFDIGTGFNQEYYNGFSILEQPDGKLLVTGEFVTYNGTSAQRVVRLNTDGTNDGTLGGLYGGTNYAQIPALQSDGKIILTGGCTHYFKGAIDNFASGIARIDANGDYDNTFVTGDGFNYPTMSAVSNSDFSMIITGYFDSYNGVSCPGGIVKLDQYGTKDTSFVSGSGFNPYYLNPNYAVKIPGELSFYVAGYFTSYNGTPANRIIKIQQDGSPDTSFNSGGATGGFNGPLIHPQIIWENKLFISYGDFTEYNGTPAAKMIILNADGSVLYAPTVLYNTPIVIGNTIFGQDTTTGHLIPLYNYIP